jgi:uncharacterized DUF497 family protein
VWPFADLSTFDSVHSCAYTGSELKGRCRLGPAQGGYQSQEARRRLADAATLLYDEDALTIRDDDEEEEEEEERYLTIGMDALGRVLVVVYTCRGDRPRLISPRRATPQERRQYEDKR